MTARTLFQASTIMTAHTPTSMPHALRSDRFCASQGFVDAVTISEDGGRASGIGYVKFKTAETAQAAITVRLLSVLEDVTNNGVVRDAWTTRPE
jgi:hypothetical protein